jgi:hypothetical protein
VYVAVPSLVPSKCPHVLELTCYVLACLVLPVAWGVGVNWLFDLWHNRNGRETRPDEPIFPDFQI